MRAARVAGIEPASAPIATRESAARRVLRIEKLLPIAIARRSLRGAKGVTKMVHAAMTGNIAAWLAGQRQGVWPAYPWLMSSSYLGMSEAGKSIKNQRFYSTVLDYLSGNCRRMSLKLEGVYSVLPTPFTAAGDLDDASLRRVVDLFIGAGVNGVTALGVTGEVARLDDSERRRVLEVVTAHVAGRIGVVAGTTAEGTRTCIDYSRHAKEAGATAVMVSPPRMPKLNSEAVVRHFHALAEAVDIEIVVQDYPPISGYAMEPGLLARIAKEIPRARTIKLEDPPTPFKTSRILPRSRRPAASRTCGSSAAWAACSCSRSCWPARRAR